MSLDRRFPVLAIEQCDLDRAEIDIVEASYIDVDLIWVRPGHIKRMDAAMQAECMLGDAGIELVGRQRVRTIQQLELLRLYDQV